MEDSSDNANSSNGSSGTVPAGRVRDASYGSSSGGPSNFPGRHRWRGMGRFLSPLSNEIGISSIWV